jgi:peptide deformylase
MAVLPLVLYPDPVLLKPTVPVAEVDDDVRAFVEDMRDTMYDAPGIGLAANQVGDTRRICIVDVTAGEEPDSLVVLINPVIAEVVGCQTGEEGCLSFPDVTIDVKRAEQIKVEALGLDGRPFELEAEGLLSRAIQHECEHLDGQVFLRNISSLKRELVKKQIRKRIRTGDWFAA